MELLTELYSIHSPTGEEWGMISFIRKYHLKIFEFFAI